MKSQGFFLEKLSPEVRLSIYSYVLGPSLVTKPSSSDTAFGVKRKKTDHMY